MLCIIRAADEMRWWWLVDCGWAGEANVDGEGPMKGPIHRQKRPWKILINLICTEIMFTQIYNLLD